jgi:hypothetical protein
VRCFDEGSAGRHVDEGGVGARTHADGGDPVLVEQGATP